MVMIFITLGGDAVRGGGGVGGLGVGVGGGPICCILLPPSPQMA